MQRIKRILVRILVSVIVIVGILLALVWVITFHPAAVQAEAVTCADNPPILQPEQSLKVLTNNVQYMSGKNYFFWYEGGEDERASPEDIAQTIEEVARIIREENPDIVLLQEVDDGSKRTDYEDQLARLLGLLSADYKCHTSAFYWKAAFVPHPSIMGAISQKLSVISKYRLQQATRYQLPLTPDNLLAQQFKPKQAILEVRLPVDEGEDFVLLTTHLEVANRGAEVMQNQVTAVNDRLDALSRTGNPWLIGGDFNLLPPGQFDKLRADQKINFRSETELKILFDKYQALPNPADIAGDDEQQWLTFFHNDPSLTEPDRTLDYIFTADNVELVNGHVRRVDTLTVSDHLPVVAEITINPTLE